MNWQLLLAELASQPLDFQDREIVAGAVEILEDGRTLPPTLQRDLKEIASSHGVESG